MDYDKFVDAFVRWAGSILLLVLVIAALSGCSSVPIVETPQATISVVPQGTLPQKPALAIESLVGKTACADQCGATGIASCVPLSEVLKAYTASLTTCSGYSKELELLLQPTK